LTAQRCAIGAQVAFRGTGPLLYLSAYQYARAGAQVVAVLDTTPFTTKAKQAFGLMRGGATFAKGLYYVAWLRAHGIPIVGGATPLAIEGNGRVESLSWRDAGGAKHETPVDAVRAALERAFPFPAKLAASIADDTILCRCEVITAGELRAAANEALATLPPPEVNRAKALTRVGMGRCQGRVCGAAAAEVLAS